MLKKTALFLSGLTMTTETAIQIYIQIKSHNDYYDYNDYNDQKKYKDFNDYDGQNNYNDRRDSDLNIDLD